MKGAPENKRVKNPIGLMEVFAGAAGLAQGFLRAGGFEVIALTDADPFARDTFLENFPETTYLVSLAQDITSKTLLDIANGRKISGILGGPPCQGFSLAGKLDDDHDLNNLVWDYYRIVKAVSPDFIVMENVPQFLQNARFIQLKKKIEREYQMVFGVLNAALFGTPQTRNRSIMIGFNKRLGVKPELPKPTHTPIGSELFDYLAKQTKEITATEHQITLNILGADAVTRKWFKNGKFDMDHLSITNLKPVVTVGQAISDLASEQNHSKSKEYESIPESSYQEMLRHQGIEILNHEPRAHSSRIKRLMRLIPEGGDLRDVDPSFWPKSHFSQAYGRLHRAGLSRTITTFFCNPGSGRFTHYSMDRALTVREAARLQGFRDDFMFLGSQETQMRLVGNAVPVPLAEAVAESIFNQLQSVNTL